MPVIEIYYANPITNKENTMLVPVSSISKIEKLTEEFCVLTLSNQTEKILVLETIDELIEKIQETDTSLPIVAELNKIASNMPSSY